ncbi:MAG: hypothetical protein GY829_15245 [Gammaproteobacteria bacterium]|nr:hypothetical protein [Gammaproteobacteria bacterium]
MKPPWIDGNLFASLHEGIHKFEFGKPVINGEMLVIPVYLEHYRENDRVEWIDILVLKKQEGVWMVHDIKYCGTWVFSYSGTLLSNLPN